MGRRTRLIVDQAFSTLAFTPVMRVFASMIFFIFTERDWLYAVITFAVLILTLAGLFLLR